ncbi:MAG: VPLPA-CTERM sorting domain-containing protein [Pseudomonadota bacterium]
MTRILAAALVLTALVSWSPAEAASWTWSYKQNKWNTLTGVIEGTLRGDGNTIDITSVSMAARNGFKYGPSVNILANSNFANIGSGITTLDGSFVNFSYTNSSFSKGFNIWSPHNTVSTNPWGSYLVKRGYKAKHWSIEKMPHTAPVPLPASGLLLLAGLGGFALLRRRKTA